MANYKQKDKLELEGSAGDKARGALTQAQTPSASAKTAGNGWSYDPFQVSKDTAAADKKRQEVAAQKPGDFSYKAYQKSDAVKQAEALLQQQLKNKPGAYQSKWQTALNETMDKILNREKFSYDLNGDALYQQYKDQYVAQGQQAMMDTMGQAQAMTGGYGNSYAQSVGQQTYQGYLQQLNDRIPELYQLALDTYNREGENLYTQYGLYADRDERDYGRYRDTVSDYNTELGRLTEDARYQSETDYGRYMDGYNMAYGEHRDNVADWQSDQARADENYWNLYNRDYGQWADNRDFSYGQYIDDRNYQYQLDRDKVADQQWQEQFDEAKRQYDQSYALSASKSKGSSGGSGGTGGSGGSGGGGYDNGSLTQLGIMALQKELGVETDGKWGPKSQTEAQKKWGVTSANDAYQIYTGGKDLNGDGYEDDPVGSAFTGFTASEWEGYFATIRQSEGQSAAEAELNELTSKGLIPKNMVSYAAIGARGGKMGH